MGSMDELRSPSLPTSPAAPVIVFPSPSMLSVLQLLGTIRCPKKPRAAHEDLRAAIMAVSAPQDLRLRPVGADGPEQPAQEGADVRALRALGGPQHGRDEAALTIEDDDRLEPVFVVVGIEQPQLLAAVHGVE